MPKTKGKAAGNRDLDSLKQLLQPNLCIIVVLEGDPALAISHQEIIKLAKGLENAT